MTVFVSPTGTKFNIKNRVDIIYEVLQTTGYFEKELIDIASNRLTSFPGTVVDAGANIGTFCLELATRFPNCEYHAFEPVPLTYQELQENIDLNCNTHIKTYNIGLADFAGELEGESANQYTGYGHISLSKHADILRRGKIDFPKDVYNVMTLDSFNLENVSLIKSDVEGMELQMFIGSIETIKRCNPMLIFEAWSADWFADERVKLFNFISALGYTLDIFGDNVIANLRD